MTSLVMLSGSSRTDSLNTKLAELLASMARDAGASVSQTQLGDTNLPIYNGDLEQESGLPAGAKALKTLFQASDGLIITCPEYNGFMTPLLLNAIDWCTRSEDASVDLSAFTDKTVLIASASPGPGGGGRANVHLRTLLSGIGSIVLPQSLTVPAAHNAFDGQGQLQDQAMTDRAHRLVKKFVELTDRLSSNTS